MGGGGGRGGAASAGGGGGAGSASTAGLSSLGRVTTTGPGIFSLLGTALGGGAGAGGGPAAFNNSILPVLRIRIRNPVSYWPLDPGWVKNQDPGWATRIIFLIT